MNCPICNGDMLVSKKHGIETKYCPQCNEIWPAKRLRIKLNQKVILSNTRNSGSISERHIYNKTNDHDLMDDNKRKKEMLYFLE